MIRIPVPTIPRIRIPLRRFALGAILPLLLLPASPADALWRDLRIQFAGETGTTSFGRLTEFTRFDDNTNSYADWDFDLENESVLGFRVGLQLHEELELSWSRLMVESRYRIREDGVTVVDDPDGILPVRIPTVDVRFDLISLRYRPERLRWRAVGPVVGLGFGWTLLSQDGPLNPPGSLRVGSSRLDFSDSDKSLELTLGLEGRWRWIRGGAALRAVSWRWDPQNEFIPARTTQAFLFDLWLGASF